MSASKPFAYLNQKPLLSDLCEHVRTERWHMLGIQLNIDTVCLNDIQVENHSEDKRRSKMFEEWLKVNPEASVGQLIEALRKESVKENVIAHKIDMIYQSHYREQRHALASQKMIQPKPVACCTSKVHHELTCTTELKPKSLIPRQPAKFKHSTGFKIIFVLMISILITIYLCSNLMVCFIIILILSVPTDQIQFHKKHNEPFEPIEIQTTTVEIQEEHVNGKKITEDENETEITYSAVVQDCNPQIYHSDPVRGSGLPLLEFSYPLIGKTYKRLTEKYMKLQLSGQFQTSLRLTDAITNSTIACDLKAVAYVFEGCAFMINNQDEPLSKAMNAFSTALEYSNQIDCKNGSLLQGMIYAYMARVNQHFRNLTDAGNFRNKAKIQFYSAAPCNETSTVFFQEAMQHIDKTGADFKIPSAVKEEVLHLLHMSAEHNKAEHMKSGRDYRSLSLMSNTLAHKALVHLNIPFLWLEQQKADYLKPTEEDLIAARSTLKVIPNDFLESPEPSKYKTTYFIALSEYHRLNGNIKLAKQSIKNAKRQVTRGNFSFNDEMIRNRLAMLSNTHGGNLETDFGYELDDILDAI